MSAVRSPVSRAVCRAAAFRPCALHHGSPAARFVTTARPSQTSVSRYRFDSNEARQIVRWRRFLGLEFAPDSRASERLGQPCRDEPGLVSLCWADQPGPAKPNQTQPNPAKAAESGLNRARRAFCVRRLALSGIRHERRLPPGFTDRLQGKGAAFRPCALHHGGQPAGFCSRPACLPQASVFRYHFDSSQARQTVRWRRFWGLEFAPDSRANKRRWPGLAGVNPALPGFVGLPSPTNAAKSSPTGSSKTRRIWLELRPACVLRSPSGFERRQA